MARKICVGVLFGGKSAEHEVSLQSARNIIDALDRGKYEVVPIGIDKQGRWHLCEGPRYLLDPNDPKKIRLSKSGERAGLVPAQQPSPLMSISKRPQKPPRIDVLFPVLHGTYGEDGTVQGLAKLLQIPFVGPDVLGSAVGMDKDVSKRLLRDADIPVANFLVFHHHERSTIRFTDVVQQLGIPFFVKPANTGSSVGISKVKNEKMFAAAVKTAFEFDTKILIEEFIEGRELECSVLGNESPRASVIGEIIPQHEFYSYEAKYLDENGALLKIPADVPPNTAAKIQNLALKTFKTLTCEGMARVDFFLRKNGELIVNEINTIPGFTRISMYPKMWEASGLAYPDLLNELIQLALRRYRRDQSLRTLYLEKP